METSAKVTGATVAGAAAVKGGLLCIGFSSAGPIAGSIAAGVQSGIGCVAAGSTFAGVQSFAMTTFFGVVSAPVLVGGALGLAVYGGYKYYQK